MTDDRRLQRAILLLQQSNYSSAEHEFRQHLLEDPEDPVAHALLGVCLSERKDFEQATEEVRLGVHYGPDIGLTHYALASVLDDRNRFDEALRALQAAIEIEPANASYYGLQASLYLKLRKWSDALESANRGLECEAENVTCSNARATALVQLGRHDEAERTIEGTLERAPTDGYAHANQGWSHLHKGEYRQASECFREALRLEPNMEWARKGMLESLKARNPLYRLLLRFFLAMSRFSEQGQWIIILLLYFGFRGARMVAQNNPEWEPYITPLLYVYIGFVIFTWIGTPLFNLLLRLDSFGKYVLSDSERRESTIFGVFLLLALSCAVAAIVYGGLFVFGAFFFGLLLLPICATFRCDAGWPRNAMIMYTSVVAMLGLSSLVAPNLLMFFALGCFLSSFAGNLLAARVPKK